MRHFEKIRISLPKWSLASASFAFQMRRRIATALAVVFAALLGYHVVFGQNGLTAYQQKRQDDRALRQQILDLQKENERLSAHVDHLKTDPGAIERIAKENLHYTRPNEVIVTLNDTPADGSNRAPSHPAN